MHKFLRRILDTKTGVNRKQVNNAGLVIRVLVEMTLVTFISVRSLSTAIALLWIFWRLDSPLNERK